MRFCNDFGEVWAGFGIGFGGPWRLVGVFQASFFKAFLPRGPKRVQEAAKRSLGLDLGRVWKGFGKGLARQNGQKIEIFVFFLDMLFAIWILVDFVRFLRISMGGMVNRNQLRAFATVKRTENI